MSLPLGVAAAYLRQQVARIRDGEQMTQECLVDGPYSYEQWVYIHLRHAELHLSFLAEKERRIDLKAVTSAQNSNGKRNDP